MSDDIIIASDDIIYVNPYMGRGFPHVVDIHTIDGPGEILNSIELTAADGVATILSLYNGGVLDKFLEPEGPEIHWDRNDRGKSTLYIGRVGHYIEARLITSSECGYYYGPNRTNWEIRLRYFIDDKLRWHPISATGSSCTKLVENNPEAIEEYGKNVATSMIMGRQWEQYPEKRIIISEGGEQGEAT